MNHANASTVADTLSTPQRASLEAEHAKIEKALSREIAKLKRSVVSLVLLADKVDARKKQRVLEENLRLHRLNYFEFVCGARA